MKDMLRRLLVEAGVFGCEILPVDQCEIDDTSSSGLPWKRLPGKWRLEDKGAFLAHYDREDTEAWFLDNETWWEEFPKVEPQKPEKRTRTICQPPAEIAILMKQYCHDFNQRMHNVWGSGIGWSKWMGGCSKLAGRFERFGYIEERDATAYDSTVPAELLRLVWELRWEAYADEHKTDLTRRILQLFFDTLSFTCVVSSNGEVYRKKGGMPSGSPTTTEDNTLVSLAIFLTHAYRCGYSLRDLQNHSELALCGDDVLLACDDHVEKLRFPYMKDFLSSLGMQWPEDKYSYGNSIVGRSFLGCKFFKRNVSGLLMVVWEPSRPGKWMSTLTESTKALSKVEYAQILEAIIRENIWLDDVCALLIKLHMSVYGSAESQLRMMIVRDRLHALGFEANGAHAIGPIAQASCVAATPGSY